MSAPALMRPLPMAEVVSLTPGDGAANLATDDPKEAYVSVSLSSASGPTIRVDLGTAASVDTFFLGWITVTPTGSFSVSANNDGGTTRTTLGTATIYSPVAGVQHALLLLASPASYRYFFLVPVNGSAAGQVQIGTVAVGKSLRPSVGGIEYGAGRFVGDTGSAERLKSGSFAIDEGATFGGYQGTMADLTLAETETLYALLRRAGSSRSVLFVENPDPDAALNERIHWGIMTRLEAYERSDPLFTKWGFRVEDWA